jgi:hypothetical protein
VGILSREAQTVVHSGSKLVQKEGEMLSRIRLAWRILRGKGFTEPRKVTYVHNVEDENKFVQLVPYQDKILALDAQGKVWIISHEHYGLYRPSCELFMESPRPY